MSSGPWKYSNRRWIIFCLDASRKQFHAEFTRRGFKGTQEMGTKLRELTRDIEAPRE